MLTRDQILSHTPKIQIERVPEWGGEIGSRVMALPERLDFDANFDQSKQVDAIALLLSLTLCDQSGALLFTLADVAALRAKEAGVLLRLSGIACRINGLTKSDLAELEKNSEANPSADSASDSPPASV